MNIRHVLKILPSKTASVVAVSLVAGLALVFAGCDSVTDFNEINQNPNDPTSAPSEQILSGLIANFSYQVAGNEAVRTPSLWTQQASQNADPPNIDNYQYQTADPNNLWEFWLYAGAMKDAKVLQETARSEGNLATVGIGQVIEAWSWMITTDLFGRIPVQEAFKDDITNPTYDDQSVAYDTVFAKLSRARQNLQQGNEEPLGGADLLYGGNVQKWLSLAWALEAKAHIHLTESGYGAGLDGSSSRTARAQAALDAVQNAFPNGNADNPAFIYPGGESAENPWYQFTIQGVWVTTHQLSSNYVSLLKNQEDPRLGIQARQVGAIDGAQNPPTAGADDFTRVPFNPSVHFDPSDDTYLGHANGTDAVGDEAVSSIGSYYSASDAPLIWMNYAEVKFIEAEARLITGSGNAAQAYEDGIRASLQQLNVTSLNGVDQSFVDNFVSDQMAEYNNASDKVREIIEEKYIANFLGLEPFNDWRRTGYPSLQPAANAVTEGGVIPRRFPYPESEFNNNSGNVPTNIGQGVNALDAPVGWDPTGGS
jgi:hypothetical protein